jgi:hypothetical protein
MVASFTLFFVLDLCDLVDQVFPHQMIHESTRN